MKHKPETFSDINQKMKNPMVFFIFSIFLQSLLIIINLRNYNIISGEMTDSMKVISGNLFLSEIILFLVLSTISLVFHFIKKKMSLLAQLILLILPIIYLFVFSVNVEHVIPSQVRIWIMPVERVVFYQFIFIMPVIFYLILSIASVPSKFSFKRELFYTVIMLAVPPFLAYLVYNILYSFLYRHFIINEFILPVFLIIGTGVMLFAVIRLVLMLYYIFSNKGRFVESIIYFLIGIVLPVGGLVLNYFFPFPTDFQSVPVYILAVLNGICLIVPETGNYKFNNILITLRLVFFPFTVYFFAVFLPFLPLSIPAILAMGAGFLMLAPTLLFILHMRRIISDYRNRLQGIRLRTRAAVIISSILLIPCLITVNGIIDKMSINQALNYIYEPDYSETTGFNGSRFFVKHGLESLERKKSGIYLPFISGYYDWLVFDNLSLPDSKLSYMYKAFFGKDIEISEKRSSFFTFLIGRTPNRRIRPVSDNFTSSKNVVISSVRHSSTYEGDFIRTSVRIEMKNLKNFQQEFRTSISVPKGVFVSNYWLHIGEEKVPGKIFEKKTAMWIYDMITTARRDPGLLFYKNPELLYLYVFPFSAHEKRITEIEFLYPSNLSPEIRIGRNIYKYNVLNQDQNYIAASQNGDKLSVLLSEKNKAGLPKTLRTPYFHFLIDWSEDSKYANADVLKKIGGILKRFPEIKYCSITLANYESSNITNGVISVDQINSINTDMFNNEIKVRGGFCRDRAMKTILVNYRKELKKSVLTDKYFLYSPVIFVIKDSNTEVLTEDDLNSFFALSPDVKYYYSYENNKININDFKGYVKNNVSRIKPDELIVLKLGGDILYTDSCKNDIVHNRSAGKFLSLEVYNPGSGSFQMSGPVKYFDKDELFSKAMQTDMLCREKSLNPSLSADLFKPLVMLSKETGILNRLTSYIVVENSAQWKILEKMEKDKLDNKESLEIVNTPEPSVLILAGLFLVFLIMRNRGVIGGFLMRLQAGR